MVSNQKGQSAIEFIMTFAVVFGLVLSFYKVAVNYTNGYIVQYATYMASRSYLVFDNNATGISNADAPAEARAREVFNSFNFSTIIPGFDGNITFNDPEYPGKKLYVGAITNFSQAFSLSGMFGGDVALNLTSESFLGRAPTRAECGIRICAAMEQVPGSGSVSCNNNVTLFDNGC